MIGDLTEAMVSDKRAEQRVTEGSWLDDHVLPPCIPGNNGPVSAPTERCMSSIVEKCVHAVGASRIRPSGNSKLIHQVDRLISRQAFEEDLDVQC